MAAIIDSTDKDILLLLYNICKTIQSEYDEQSPPYT